MLFEPMTNLTAQLLEDEVRSAIESWENRAQVVSINVIPEEEYNRLMKTLTAINLSNIIEEEDETDLKGELACAGGACEIV